MADERRQKARVIAMQRPQSQASVFAAAGKKPRVGREFHGVDGAGVAMQRGKQRFRAQLPQSYGSIQPAARNQPHVDAERHAPNAGGVTTQRGWAHLLRRLGQELAMKLREVMSTDVEVVGPEATVAE